MTQLGGTISWSSQLEVCHLAGDKPKIEVHPLGIGGKEGQLDLYLRSSGDAIVASLVDMGGRHD